MSLYTRLPPQGTLTDRRLRTEHNAASVWARIPEGFGDAIDFNEMLISKGVAGVPGGAFADSEAHDNYMRLCIAREDDVLHGALDKIKKAVLS